MNKLGYNTTNSSSRAPAQQQAVKQRRQLPKSSLLARTCRGSFISTCINIIFLLTLSSTLRSWSCSSSSSSSSFGRHSVIAAASAFSTKSSNNCRSQSVSGIGSSGWFLQRKNHQQQLQRQRLYHPFISKSSSSSPYLFSSFAQRKVSLVLAMSSLASPPPARREEDRVVYVGAAPPGWDPSHPRQAQDSTEELVDPPVPIKDPYGWIRDDKRKSKEVIDHLEAENAYTKAIIKHLEPLQEELYKEFLASIQETDYTTPRPRGSYWYYTRTFEGKSYQQFCRAKKDGENNDSNSFQVNWDGSKETPILPNEQVYLDVNQLAEGKSYCSVGAARVSPSQKYLAYSVDYKGDETYEVHVRDLETGKEVPLKSLAPPKEGADENASQSTLLETSGTVFWGSDDNTLFYMTMDEAHRPYRLYRRDNWQTETPTDHLLMEELDDVYWAHAFKSMDNNYIFFESASSETSEVWFLKLGSIDNTEMQCISKRRKKVLYEIEHRHGEWWIYTNVGGSPNMKLMKAPATADCADAWELVSDADGTPVFDGSYEKALSSVTVFENHVVVQGRQGGIPRVWIYYPTTKALEMLKFDEPAHDVGLSTNYEFGANSIAVSYDSLTTPLQTIEISLDSPADSRKVLKAKNVPGYEKEIYGCDRLHVLSRDGKTQIPISVVYRNDVMEKVKNGERVPVHLYGYGSYESCCEADFSSTRLPLLNRGMIYVIAHIRGGGEMGRQWYEEPNGAKYLCKKNTFNDFVDVARFLVKDWTTPQMLSCEGRSAGGMLIGATINQAPELFRVAIMGVPFVDVVATMTDASIPLTCGEWEEWGNPNEKKFFQYMMEYSPMNNVQSGVKYPSCWITGGLHDPRVAYWEPAKFAATLRHANPNNENPVCVKIDTSAGHFSASDRYKYLKELSIDYSFLLDQLGLAK